MVALRRNHDKAESQDLVLVDPWQKTVVWTIPLRHGAKAALVDDTTAAVLDRTGGFMLFDLRSGEAHCRQELEPEWRLSGLYVQASQSCLLVLANQPSRRELQGETVEAPQEPPSRG